MSYIDKIKEISEKILKDCTVEMVIGFRKGDRADDERALLCQDARRGRVSSSGTAIAASTWPTI